MARGRVPPPKASLLGSHRDHHVIQAAGHPQPALPHRALDPLEQAFSMLEMGIPVIPRSLKIRCPSSEPPSSVPNRPLESPWGVRRHP